MSIDSASSRRASSSQTRRSTPTKKAKHCARELPPDPDDSFTGTVDTNADIVVHRPICINGHVLPLVPLNGDLFAKLCFHDPLNMPWIRAAIGHDLFARRCPDKTFLHTIRAAIKHTRGKPDRNTDRLDKEGAVQSMVLEIEVESEKFKVANILWPIHVEATTRVLTLTLDRLKDDFKRVHDADTNEDADDDQGIDDESVQLAEAKDSSDDDDWSINAIVKEEHLPANVFWAGSRRSFVVSFNGERALFRVQKRKCKNHAGAKAEIARQFANAVAKSEAMQCNVSVEEGETTSDVGCAASVGVAS